MNDRTSRRHTLYAAAGLVPALLLVGCGSSASPSSSSGSGTQAHVSERDEAVRGGGAGGAAAVQAHGVTEGADFRGDSVEPPLSQDFLCMRDPVAFDLSKLDVAPGTSLKFRTAWRYVQSLSTIPGFVVAYAGTRTGTSTIGVRVGPVHHATAGLLGFMHYLPPTSAKQIGLYPNDPFHMYSVNHGEWVVAMGTPLERHGFVVSKTVVDGRLSPDCGTLSNVRVTLTLPGRRNTKQVFGDALIEDELGVPNVDTDQDGKPDGWNVELTGASLEAMDFKL